MWVKPYIEMFSRVLGSTRPTLTTTQTLQRIRLHGTSSVKGATAVRSEEETRRVWFNAPQATIHAAKMLVECLSATLLKCELGVRRSGGRRFSTPVEVQWQVAD